LDEATNNEARNIEDREYPNHCMLQWLTHSVTPWQIDRVVLTMEGDSRNGPQLATFARYNVLLEPGWMKTEVEIEQALDKLAKIAEMDDPTNMDELADIGRIAAAKQVKPEHFPASFDVM
jgi:hypothetical protein